jgi:hypothetical protein
MRQHFGKRITGGRHASERLWELDCSFSYRCSFVAAFSEALMKLGLRRKRFVTTETHSFNANKTRKLIVETCVL